jgi:hypothetical protein
MKYIHKALMLIVGLYECEICSLTLRAEHALRASEHRTLRKLFGPKVRKYTEGTESLIMRGFIIRSLYKML